MQKEKINHFEVQAKGDIKRRGVQVQLDRLARVVPPLAELGLGPAGCLAAAPP